MLKIVHHGSNISIIKCYNKGSIIGKNNVAGLISTVQNAGVLNITSSYNIGALSGTAKIGGLLAWQRAATAKINITNSYAAGPITGGTSVGGIIGAFTGSSNITWNNVYYLNTTATYRTGGGTSKTGSTDSTTMMSQIFAEQTLGSDFKYNAGGYPKLKWEK